MKILGLDIKPSKQKETTIIRDNRGNVVRGVDFGSVEKYLSAFKSVYSSKNYITAFHTISELQFPIMAIVNRMLKAEFYLKDYDTDSPIWDYEKVNKFLTQPNPIYDFNEFLTMLAVYLLVTGDSYLYAPYSDVLGFKSRIEKSETFWVLPSDCIEPEYPLSVKLFQNSTEDLIKQYKLNSGLGNNFFKTDNVLHLKQPNLVFDRWALKGRSKLESVDYPLSNLCAVYEARNVIYVKRGAIGAIVNKKTDSAGSVSYTPEEKEELKKEFYEGYGVGKDKNPFILSDVPIDFVRFNMSIDELKPFDETLADAIAIAGAFGVPSGLIPRKDSPKFDNQKESEVNFYDNTIIPFTNYIVNKINNFLGLSQTSGGRYIYADFSKISVLQKDKKSEAEINKVKSETALLKFKNGMITYNEMLSEIGKESEPNGDVYIWSFEHKDIYLNKIQQ